MKLIKYFFVGGAAAVVDIGLFYLCAGIMKWDYLVVGLFSFLLATLFNYVLSVRVVFQSGVRYSRHHEMILVFLISGAGLLLNQTILYLAVALLTVEPQATRLLAAKLIATAGVFLWNYVMRSRFVFAAKNDLGV